MAHGAPGADGAVLATDGVIALPDTAGRIDHLAVDLARKHLFVAELGNGSVDVVDLAARKVFHRIAGLKDPQGIAYDEKFDLLAVASGGDGTLRLYSGRDFTPRGVLALGDDADNLRVDPAGHVIVGYGGGALAVIDPVKLRKIAQIDLPGHPESFQIDGVRVFINIPDAGQIAVADLGRAVLTGRWKPPKLSANFPMALDGNGHVAIAFRSPPRLALIDQTSGTILASVESCGDADDLFFDAARKRFYVSCGSGSVDVVAAEEPNLRPVSRVPTSWGARTALFVPELDRLFVAERAGLLGSQAAIAVFAPRG